MSGGTEIILVHGGFHDGSAWDQTRGRLEANGYRVASPTLAGHGREEKGDVTHADQVDNVLRALESMEGDEVVLLGHSYAGCVVQKVAEAAPHRIARLVMHAAIVVRPGESVADALPRGFLNDESLEHPYIPVPAFEDVAGVYFNDMTLAEARAAHALLTPSPTAPVVEPLDTRRFFELPIPKSVLVGTEDRAMPPGYAYHPYYSSRLGEFDLVEIKGGHELLFSAPDRLAEAIELAAHPASPAS